MNLFNTAYGWTAGLETTNVFGQHGGVLNGSDVTALTNIGMTKLNMQGVTLWAGNHLWTIAVSGVVPDVYKVSKDNFGGSVIPGLRLAFTPTIMGWDVDIGGGMLNGTAGGIKPSTGKRFAGAHMDFLDAQAQGYIDDVGVGVYADYAYTIAKSGVEYNLFGATPLEMDSTGALIGGDAGAGDRTGGWSLRAMVKPMEGWIFGGGYGETRNKTATGVSSNSSVWIYRHHPRNLRQYGDQASVWRAKARGVVSEQHLRNYSDHKIDDTAVRSADVSRVSRI